MPAFGVVLPTPISVSSVHQLGSPFKCASVQMRGRSHTPVYGRGHNPFGFTTLMAGGGIRGGIVHGATDEYGYRAIDGKVHVHDLHATMLHQLGLDHERLTYRFAGRDFRLTDVHGTVVKEILV